MEVIGFRKHTANIFGDTLEPDLFIVGHSFLLLLDFIEVVEGLLGILQDYLSLLLDLVLSPAKSYIPADAQIL